MLTLNKPENRCSTQVNAAFSMAAAATGIIACAAISIIYIIFNANKK